MNEIFLNLYKSKYGLPSAADIREYQSERREHVINNIKRNAKEGYYGVSVVKEKVYEALEKELIEKGYTVEFNDKFCSIKWGNERWKK